MLWCCEMTVWWTLSVGLAAPLSSQASLQAGAAAPDFTLKQLTGGDASLSDLRGRPVLVNFWATWCKPCRAEMPEIISAYQAHRDVGLEVRAVNLTDQENMKDVRKFAVELGLPFPSCEPEGRRAGAVRAGHDPHVRLH